PGSLAENCPANTNWTYLGGSRVSDVRVTGCYFVVSAHSPGTVALFFVGYCRVASFDRRHAHESFQRG
ncbi:MAG: hypothetical protein Q8M91_07440, partial [Polaromonas sp.]|nr:hypothetical protein [Polaromonas sp.]